MEQVKGNYKMYVEREQNLDTTAKKTTKICVNLLNDGPASRSTIYQFLLLFTGGGSGEKGMEIVVLGRLCLNK